MDCAGPVGPQKVKSSHSTRRRYMFRRADHDRSAEKQEDDCTFSKSVDLKRNPLAGLVSLSCGFEMARAALRQNPETEKAHHPDFLLQVYMEALAEATPTR